MLYFIKVRRFADLFIFALLILILGLLPFYIINTYKLNKEIISQVNNINRLFVKLDNAHERTNKLNLRILEFRKEEHACYLAAENKEFIKILNQTLTEYEEYVINDKKLRPSDKAKLIKHINIIKAARDARINLANKLVEYDRKIKLNKIK